MTNPSHLARTSDPDSSHEAAEQVARSGRRRTHCDQLAAALERYPCKSTAWLGRQIGMDRVEAARRMADLDNAGRARRHPELLYCPVSRRRVLAWWPVLRQGRLG